MANVWRMVAGTGTPAGGTRLARRPAASRQTSERYRSSASTALELLFA